MHYFSSSMLYPTTSSSIDPATKKAKNSPNFVAFNGLEQVNILWAQRPSLVSAELTQRPQRKAPQPQRTNPVPRRGHAPHRPPDMLPLFPHKAPCSQTCTGILWCHREAEETCWVFDSSSTSCRAGELPLPLQQPAVTDTGVNS